MLLSVGLLIKVACKRSTYCIATTTDLSIGATLYILRSAFV